MALPFVEDAARLAVVGLHNGQESIVTIGFTMDNGWGDLELQDLADGVLAGWIAQVLPELSLDYTLLRVEARGLRSAGDFATEALADPATVGGNLGASDNNATATVVKLATGRSGKSYRGRIFVGGVPNASVVNGFLDSTYRTNVAVGVNNMLAGLVTGNLGRGVIISYWANKVLRTTPLVTNITQAVNVTAYPGSANRRRPVSS